MKPLEIYDYKRQWIPKGHVVVVHSDWRWECKDWIKSHLRQHQWHMKEFTGVYEDTYMFESEVMANKFQKQFSEQAVIKS